ncbi:MAG: ClpXP protease specificity-enhancing factor SspB [Minwuiales bacterium]|nr:ClpXP protease specificity-enhancing factor SspB [Minwuiales bacterium]
MEYNRMVEKALRGVVRDALEIAAERGLQGNHHFYISFDTRAPGVDIPEYLKQRYSDEMTIVLQHQFWGLEFDDIAFEVTLSFNKVHERLHIPFAAITAFADPSVQFGLQFRLDGGMSEQALDGLTTPKPPGDGEPALPAVAETADGDEQDDGEKTGQVITLDSFRKKK